MPVMAASPCFDTSTIGHQTWRRVGADLERSSYYRLDGNIGLPDSDQMPFSRS